MCDHEYMCWLNPAVILGSALHVHQTSYSVLLGANGLGNIAYSLTKWILLVGLLIILLVHNLICSQFC